MFSANLTNHVCSQESKTARATSEDAGGCGRRSTSAVCGPLARVYSAGLGGRSRGTSRGRGRRGASGWWLWSARRARVRAVRTAWCVVQTTASKPRAPLRLRRRSKATRRCRRSTSVVCGPLARAYLAGMGDRSRGASRVCGRRGGSGWWLWSARRARVRAVRTAWCVVQTTTSAPGLPLRWRRRSKATRRCRRSSYTVCGPLARVHSLREWAAAPGGLARARAGRA